MSIRLFALLGAGSVFALSLGSVPALGQSWVTDSACPDDHHLNFHRCAVREAPDFDPPRTPWGDPDLQGIWRRRAAAHESIEAHPPTLDDAGGPSLIVDPESGSTPFQPWAEAQRRYNQQRYVHHNAICRLDGVPLTMYMTGTYQFMQTPDHFIVQGEEAHAYRSIPLDGRPHLEGNILLWNGDSVGRWEGNTLVIETTNQNAVPWLDQRGRFYTNEAHVVERLTLVDEHTIHYQATVEDDNVFTRPFTIALAYRRSTDEEFEVWEEACFENNDLAMQNFMNVGYQTYRGIAAREARLMREAYEQAQEAGQ